MLELPKALFWGSRTKRESVDDSWTTQRGIVKDFLFIVAESDLLKSCMV